MTYCLDRSQWEHLTRLDAEMGGGGYGKEKQSIIVENETMFSREKCAEKIDKIAALIERGRKEIVGTVKTELRDGMAIVRIGSHRAREKLKRLFGGAERQGYYKWNKPGEWREVSQEEMNRLREKPIKGVTQSKWDDDLRKYIDWGYTRKTPASNLTEQETTVENRQ